MALQLFQWLHSSLVQHNYVYVAETERDIQHVLSSYSGLRPKFDKYVFRDGHEETMLCLSGTIPINFKGNQYNIPVEIWICIDHPSSSPICYVVPTSSMLVKKSNRVDSNGLIYLPYLSAWQSNNSSLVELVSIMVNAFSQEPPVYARSSANAQPQQPQQYGQPLPQPSPSPAAHGNPSGVASYGGYGTAAMPDVSQYLPGPSVYTSSNPYAPPGVYTAGPVKARNQDPGPAPVALPPSSNSNSNSNIMNGLGNAGSSALTNELKNKFGGSNGSLPAGSSSSSSSSSVVSSFGSKPVEDYEMSKEEEKIRLASLQSAVEDRIKQMFREFEESHNQEMASLRSESDALIANFNKVNLLAAKIEEEQAKVEENSVVLEKAIADLKQSIAKLESLQDLPIDDVVVTTAPLFKQLFVLVAEENAIADTLYHLGKAFNSHVIDLPTYIKNVRNLSRMQFMKRAKIKKAREVARLRDI